MTAPVLLSLKEVNKLHGRVQALQGVNFSIAQGEAVALVGAPPSARPRWWSRRWLPSTRARVS